MLLHSFRGTEVPQSIVNCPVLHQLFQGDFAMLGALRDAQLSLLGAVPLSTDIHPLLLFTCQVTLSEQ